jgi:CoA:oxalate CoA-transferase
MSQEMQPLDDIRIIDLTHYINGPYATMLLSYLGAEVIKVESPRFGDGIRSVYRPPGKKSGLPFALMNFNKRSITLNLKSEEGREIFKRMAQKADVVVENYEAGTMERMGLGYELLRGLNPRLIYASGTGYGQTGPNRDLPAFDPIIQATSGIMAVTGESGGPPLKAGVVMVDVLGAVHLCAGILAAIRQRDRTGQGVSVEISMQEAVLPTLAMQIGAFYAMGITSLREGNGSAGGVLAPYNTYPASDGWITIMAAQPARFRELCRLMGKPQIADEPRYAKLAGRSQNREELDRTIADWTRTKTRQELMDELSAAGVLCGIVKELPEVMSEPHLFERGALREVDHPELGRMTIINSPIRMGGEPATPKSPSPALGADNEDFYREELGLTADQVADLRERGVI